MTVEVPDVALTGAAMAGFVFVVFGVFVGGSSGGGGRGKPGADLLIVLRMVLLGQLNFGSTV